jgi:aminopeptidase N
MFGKIAGFEFRYQTRQPVFWVTAIVFFLLSFAVVASDQVSLGGVGNVKENSPFAIAFSYGVWSLFFMFVTTAFVANVVVRDVDTGFGPIIRATRINKFDYLIGRFSGAFAAALVAFLAVPLGIVLGSYMPWVDKETIGPNLIQYYVVPYLMFAVPNLFLTASLFFALATVTRSMMWTYVGMVGFLIAYTVLNALTAQPEYERVSAWAEPFGISAYSLVTKYWTAAERNSLLPPFEGVLLYNRLIALGVGYVALMLGFALFRFETKGAKLKKAEKLKAAAEKQADAPPLAGPLPRPVYDGRTARMQLWARTKFEMGQVFKSPAFFVLLVLGLFNAAGALFFDSGAFGVETWPVTRQVIENLQGSFTIIPLLIAIYYAGELVWRERDRKTHEIVDSSAAPDWAFAVPKTLAISLVLIATLLVSVVAGVVSQAVKGYTDFELEKYLVWYVLPETVNMVHLAVLAVFFQVLSPHKFIGWGLMLIYLISRLVASNLGFDHPLYNYSAGIAVPLSDMNGQGDFWKGRAWLDAYWSAFAIILVVLAYGLWRRGTETRLAPRLGRLPARLKGPAGVVTGVAALAFVGIGAFVFVNTNVWNEYRNRQDGERFAADYEKTLLKYETVAQPNVTDVTLAVDLDPHAPRLTVRGTYLLENRTGAPLAEAHLRFARDTEVKSLAVQGATPARTYDRFNYRIYRFATPMRPGERRTLTFETEVSQRGFRAGGNITNIVDNGTFVNNFDFAPVLGMDRSSVLRDRATRRKYGLPAELRMAKLEDDSARRRNYAGNVDWVRSDITVTTVADQTPVAPGYKVSETVRDGRRTARFVSEAPILHFFSIQSARYAVRKETYKGVELAIYHHPEHAYNVDKMIDALKVGLDYFQANFSPYQFRQARILEFPGYASFAQAFANTMPYSESIGFIARFKDEEKVDYVTYVTAHELGHQWWAHQVVSSDQEGATTLTETLASYSAYMAMEKLYGPEMMRKFTKLELDRYLRSRGTEAMDERPLYRVESEQGYIHYQKGGLVMYLLRDLMGEEAVNRALRRLIADHAFQGAPYPRSLELIAALRAEASPEQQDLITDLFQRITLYDAKVTDASARKRPDGRFDVTVTVEAKKLYADGEGVETEAPMTELFDVGLFTAEPGKKGYDRSDVILVEKRPIRSGVNTLSFVTDREPKFAGVDPFNKRIDRNSDDNLKGL